MEELRCLESALPEITENTIAFIAEDGPHCDELHIIPGATIIADTTIPFEEGKPCIFSRMGRYRIGMTKSRPWHYVARIVAVINRYD